MSLPVRERGLKPLNSPHISLITFVAPRAGAWIETHRVLETQSPALSLPVRERGLKHLRASTCHLDQWVAPRAGAWIETYPR